MSFFKNIFGGSTRDNSGGADFWKPLHTEDMLDEAVKKSFERKVVIFKHSTRCHISKTVLRNFEKATEGKEKQADYYFLDLLQHRDLSNRISEIFEIQHQSPQVLVIESGKVTHDASHHSISAEKI